MRVYQIAEIIYDITYLFVKTHLQKGDRTVDQMLQAARSGKQNIAEGSAAGVASKETEIKLTNVAKASLQELLIDYEDFLRTRNLRLWNPDSDNVNKTRRYCNLQNDSSEICIKLGERSAETHANIAITLIHQADSMLRRLIERQKRDFLEYGGIREQMSSARREFRKNLSDRSDRRDRSNMRDMSDRSNKSDKSDKSDMSDMSDKSDRSNKSDMSDNKI